MTSAELAAYIGAAAWLPQIYRWFARPKVDITSAATVEIGYTTFGPVVNLSCAISAERRDAVIKQLTLNVTHEKGDTRRLTWMRLNETPFKLRVPTGENMDFVKEQPAIALLVSTAALTEKVICFQDLAFQVRALEHLTKLIDRYHYLRSRPLPAGDLLPAIMESEEMIHALDFFKTSMYWNEGKYTFQLDAVVARLRSPHKQTFSVELSKPQVDNLRANYGQFDLQLPTLLGEKTTEKPWWNWSYPQIQAVK